MTVKNMYRLEQGGMINRDRPLKFTFDGRPYKGFAGDTLASALLANGVRHVGRSFKYHRPRGIMTSGVEEPNALVSIGEGGSLEPNVRATVQPLLNQLAAQSQNRWPSLRFDIGSINDRMAPLLTAGFYYKTFMWPASFWEEIYEPFIRKAAGLGALSGQADTSHSDKGNVFCDLLVIGAGPAGLISALMGARAGLRVLLCDEQPRTGGRLLAEEEEIDGKPAFLWVQTVIDELQSSPNVTIKQNTTVYGAYDHGVYGAYEIKRGETPDQILWRIRAKRSILASGSIERLIAFSDNDRPGIMQAGAVRDYVHRYAVAPGKEFTIFTNNDSGWRTARDLAAKGIHVAALIDSRPDVASRFGPQSDFPLIENAVVTGTKGRHGLKRISVKKRDGASLDIHSDCLSVSGGWNPALHLTCHQRGRPVYDETIASFVPGSDLPAGMAVAGSAAGVFNTKAVLEHAVQVAGQCLEQLGYSAKAFEIPQAQDGAYEITPLWQITESTRRAWVDFQNDVTTKDIEIAHLEGMGNAEHLKRYTTLGMATDQGKTGNITALGILSEITGQPMAQTGTTVFRPPYTPVPIAAFAGHATEEDFRPKRLTPSHTWAKENGAVFVEAGTWFRSQYFVKKGETHWLESASREAKAVRRSVGICDVSTLGKIDIQGTDCLEFVNFVYANGFAKLATGRCRYGIMLREDGFVMDDGTCARLGEHHLIMTTTTGNAPLVYRHLEFVRQCLKPELDVHLQSVTEQWAQFAVAGPNARELLNRVLDQASDLDDEHFPFMAAGTKRLKNGEPVRLFRISFSGELAYEIAVRTSKGLDLWTMLLKAGDDLEATPYGTEALSMLRVEKGHPVAAELNGQTSAHDLGMGRMLGKTKDAIGLVMARRDALCDQNRPQLVGLKPLDPQRRFRAGSHLFDQGVPLRAEHDQGWISSSIYSPHLNSQIGLGFLKNGFERYGETIIAADPLKGVNIKVEVCSPHFIDPQGERLRG